MAQPMLTEVHIDTALSNISIAFKNDNYVADKVFPLVPVDKQSDYFFTFTRDFWFRNSVERRGPGAKYPEGGLQIASTQYLCINKAESFPLPRETIDNQDAAIDLRTDGADWLAQQFMLDREIALAAKIFNANAWGSSATKSGTGQWSDYANSDPIADIETAIQTVKKAIGINPNKILMGVEVWDKLKFHPDLLDMYKHTSVPIMKTAMVAAIFDGVDEILVGNAIQNSSAEGVTFSGGYIWPKNVLVAYVPKSASIRTPAAGYTFVWRQKGFEIVIREVPEDLRNRDMLLADHAYDQKITSNVCGYEIITATA